ncbi:WYL domain-containing protein [Candidatus Stoquefichus massiliensis]|uniref:WYL domain-containing protein n=1 Tax=Candidatus Stoquefichus massiliensis TaxID=1470350 RepID=UPI0018C8DF5D
MLLKTIVLNHREVNFIYYNSSGNKSGRQCYPLKLLYIDKAWYLFRVCCIIKDYRLFSDKKSNI